MSKERLLKMYELMLLTRGVDETLMDLFKGGHIPGFIHLGIGQEAVPVGACFDLREEDYVFIHHRGFGHSLTKGLSPQKIAAELCGKVTGYSKGKGGFHIADPEKGVMGISGSVGANFPLSVGAGITCQFRKKDQVVLSFYGDGTANREVAGPSMNLASVWKLPVVFICENNGWAITVPMEKSTATPRISDRAAAYGMPGETVDGNDILVVNEAVNRAVERARNGEGPSLIECTTYRWRPHAEGYPYFAAEADAVKGKDFCPIDKLKESLAKEATEQELAEVEAKVDAILKETYEFAVNSPQPEPEQALEGLYIRR